MHSAPLADFPLKHSAPLADCLIEYSVPLAGFESSTALHWLVYNQAQCSLAEILIKRRAHWLTFESCAHSAPLGDFLIKHNVPLADWLSNQAQCLLADRSNHAQFSLADL